MITIRPLAPADAEAYIALRAEMLVAAPLAFGSSPGHDRASDLSRMREQLGGPEFVIIGAIDGEGSSAHLVGVAGVMRETAPKRRHIAAIWGVYLTPAHRGAGIADRLLRGAIDAARLWSGVASVRLSVSDAATAARRLYERLGFRTWGLEPDGIRLPGENAAEGPTEHHMILSL